MEVKFTNTFNFETRNGFPDIYFFYLSILFVLFMYTMILFHIATLTFFLFPNCGIHEYSNVQMLSCQNLPLYSIIFFRLVYKSNKSAFIPKVNKTLQLMSPAFLSKAVTYNEHLYFVIVYLYLKD